MEEQEKTQLQTGRSHYRSSFAATLLFSGVQLYQIFIRIIRSKFVALFIGPGGMGITSLLRSTTDTISAATNLGLNTSSVKTISAANREGDLAHIARNVKAQRRLILLTGIIGTLICAILAPFWSQVSFGNSDYIWAFVIVSIIVLLDQLNKGELALLQGLQQKKQLARANIIGQTLNAVITIPLYYFFGVKAIVAALVLGSMLSLTISLYFSRRIEVKRIQMSWKETFSIGHEMIKLGFFLSLQFLMASIVMWIIRNYVSSVGGVDDVGLYSAGTTIITTYIGLVFSAIATDYFPRLAATKGNKEMGIAVRTQAELTILLLAPLAVAFLLFCRPVIILLYSEKFLPIEHMMYWSVGGVLVQAMGWAMSHTLLAKAKPSYFFLNEFFAAILGLPIKLYFYKNWGLTGFGMATALVYLLYLVQVLFVTKKLFDLSYEKKLWGLSLLLYIPVLLIVMIKLYLPLIISYVIGIVILFLTCYLVFLRLDKKIGIKEIIIAKFGHRN